MTRKLSLVITAVIIGCLTCLICTQVPNDIGTLKENIGATTLLSPADASTDNILTPKLVWASVPGATRYSVQVSTADDFSAIVFKDTAVIDTFKVVGGLGYQTKYYWRVQVHGSSSSSDWTARNAFTTKDSTVILAPDTPKTVSPANGVTGQPLSLTLRWDTVAGATAYAIQVASDSGFATIVTQDLSFTATSKAVSGLAGGVTYYWRVAAINTAGQSGWSDKMVFTTATKAAFALTVSATNGRVTKDPDLTAYDSGTVVTLTPVPDSNYHFSGWSGAMSGSANPDTIIMSGAKSVTANFAVNSSDSFSLTVLATNGKVKKTPDLLQYASGSFVGLKATANTGYHFVNWNNNAADTTDSTSILMTGAKSVTANFAINAVSSDTVTFDKNDAAAAGAMTPQVIPNGSSAPLTANTYTKTGWTFAGWMTSPTGTTIAFADKASYTMGTTSVTLWAKWTRKTTFVLTISATNGSVTRVPDLTAYDSGTVVTLTPVPANNYHFSGWSGALTGVDNPATITMNGAKSVTAGFAINSANSFALTVLANNGTVKKTPDLPQYDSGSSIGLKAKANAGYHFVDWSGDAAGTTDSTTILMTGAKSVTANFAINAITSDTITFDKNDPAATGAMARQIIASDSSAPLTANAYTKTGWTFAGWMTSATGTMVAFADHARYTMGTANVTLYAKWSQILNTSKALTVFGFTTPSATGTINESAKTVAVTVPYGTNVTALVANFTTSGASVKVGSTIQASGVTANNFTNPVTYTVAAADGSTQNYVVTISVALNSAKALTAFSFSSPSVTGTIDESAKTVAVIVPYGINITALVATFSTSGSSVKIGSAVQTSGVTANNFTNPLTYTVTAADGSTQNYVLTVSVALNSAKALTAFSFSSLSVTGTINESARTVAITVPYGTSVTVLVATFATSGASVKIGSTVQTSGVTADNFTGPVTYTVTAADGSTQDYVVTVSVALNPAKALAAFSFSSPSVTGTINESAKTVAVTVPYGTGVTALVATFTTSGASVKIGSTVQTSGVTANNFTSPVTYTVTAADGTTANYVVTVTIAPNPAKTLTAFGFISPSATGTINESAKTVAVTLPCGNTAVTALVATFSTTGSSIKVGSTVQTSGSTANNFTNPVTYVVTAADGSTASYVVTVTANQKPAVPTNVYAYSPVCTGLSTTLTAVNQTSGTTLVWYKGSCGGTPFGSGTSLSSGALTSTTTFYVRAESATCNSDCAAPITITVNALSIRTQPQENYICPGSSATMQIDAPCAIYYTWYQDNSVIDPSNPDFDGQTTLRLNIHSSATNVEHTYSCLVSNGATSLLSNGAMLHLSTITISGLPTLYTRCYYSKDSISISVSGAVSSYQWYYRDYSNNVTALSDGSYYSGVKTNKLYFMVPTPSDFPWGNYYCVVTSSSGCQDTSGDCNVVSAHSCQLNHNTKGLSINKTSGPRTIEKAESQERLNRVASIVGSRAWSRND